MRATMIPIINKGTDDSVEAGVVWMFLSKRAIVSSQLPYLLPINCINDVSFRLSGNYHNNLDAKFNEAQFLSGVFNYIMAVNPSMRTSQFNGTYYVTFVGSPAVTGLSFSLGLAALMLSQPPLYRVYEGQVNTYAKADNSLMCCAFG